MEDDSEAPKSEKAMGIYARLVTVLFTNLFECREAAYPQQTMSTRPYGKDFPISKAASPQVFSNLDFFQCRAREL